VEGGDNEDEGEQTETDMPRDRATAGPAGAARATRSLLARPFPDAFLITTVSSAQIIELLGATGLHQILASHGLLGNRSRNRDLEDDDEDLQGGYGGLGTRRRRKAKPSENKFPEVPSKEGQELMDSGTYGSPDHFVDTRKKRKTHLGTRLMYREMGVDTRGTQNRANMLMSQVRQSRLSPNFTDDI
jgi:hypothetical protein